MQRTLFFSNPYHLSTRLEQLVIAHKDTGEERTAPIEDLGYIILDHPQITFTQSVMQALSAANVAVVICDQKHHPASMLFHLDTHYVQSERFRHQVNASEPLKKQLWQQTIKEKLRNQAAMLDYAQKEGGNALRQIATDVLSGDTTNREAHASRLYWSFLFGENFKRERFGDSPNNLLNYGYAIIRAAIAKGLVASGLLPTLGIHHRNKYNAYCLADDIMEPFRPFTDRVVWDVVQEEGPVTELSKEHKGRLLETLTSDTLINSQMSPLQVALQTTCSSLAKCFEGKTKKVVYPQLPV